MTDLIGSQSRCIRCRQPAHVGDCLHPLDRPGHSRDDGDAADDAEPHAIGCPPGGSLCNWCTRSSQRDGWHDPPAPLRFRVGAIERLSAESNLDRPIRVSYPGLAAYLADAARIDQEIHWERARRSLRAKRPAGQERMI